MGRCEPGHERLGQECVQVEPVANVPVFTLHGAQGNFPFTRSRAERQVQLGEAFGVGDELDGDDSPFAGRQRVEYHQQREADRLTQRRLLCGVPPYAGGWIVSGTGPATGSSRRASRERGRSRQTRPTTVVSQRPRS